MIRIAIVGTRPPPLPSSDFEAIVDDVRRVLARRLARGPFTIVTGGADGVDAIAEAFALSRGLHCIVIRPHYESIFSPRAAPVIRNGVIANECDAMIAWPKRTRGGTDTAIEWARRYDRPCVVRRPWERA